MAITNNSNVFCLGKLIKQFLKLILKLYFNGLTLNNNYPYGKKMVKIISIQSNKKEGLCSKLVLCAQSTTIFKDYIWAGKKNQSIPHLFRTKIRKSQNSSKSTKFVHTQISYKHQTKFLREYSIRYHLCSKKVF